MISFKSPNIFRYCLRELSVHQLLCQCSKLYVNITHTIRSQSTYDLLFKVRSTATLKIFPRSVWFPLISPYYQTTIIQNSQWGVNFLSFKLPTHSLWQLSSQQSSPFTVFLKLLLEDFQNISSTSHIFNIVNSKCKHKIIKDERANKIGL